MASNLFFMPYRPAYDSAGVSVPGAKAYFTLIGTNTPSAPFSDAALTVPRSNPVVADAIGKFPTTYVNDAITYRVRIYSRDATVGVDTPLEEFDPYIPGLFDSLVAGAKGDPGSPGEGYPTRAAMAARAAPALLDDVYLTEAGREGKFVVAAAASYTAAIAADTLQGVFVPSTADATKVYIRKFVGPLDIRWFGAVADNSTDCYPAFAGALSLLAAIGNALDTNGLYAPPLRVPAASNKYYVSQTVDFNLAVTIVGDGSQINPASALRFAAGQTGFRAQSYNTSGASTTGASHTRSQGCIFRGLAFYGGYTNLASEGEFHGVHIKDRTFVEDCYLENWQGDCFYIFANAGNGNANGWNVRRCRGVGSRRMLYVEGSDTNAGKGELLDSALMRASGIEDVSFIGANTYDTCQVAHSGEAANSGVLFGGNAYWVVAGQEAAATTNAPSGTTADNAWWYYVSPAANHNTGVNAYPAWTSGMAQTRAVGAYNTHGSTVTLLNCYSESAQVSQLQGLTLVIHKHGHGAPLQGTYTYVDSSGGFLTVNKFNATDVSQLDNFVRLTGNIGFPGAASGNAYLYHNNASGLVLYGEGTTNDLLLANKAGATVLSVSTGTVDVSFGGNALLPSGGVLKVNGTQVVSARQTGWAADTGTAKKTANATYAAGTTLTYSATYVQSEQTAAATRLVAIEAALQNLSQKQKAVTDALLTHGLVG